MLADPRAQEVLSFWFGQSVADDRAIGERMPAWFGSSADTDRAIRERFTSAAQEAAAGALGSWRESARTRLALIILLDQFPRNLNRGTPAAFAQDELALDLCLDGLEAELQIELDYIEQVFFMMPLQHSEKRHVQNISVRQFEMLLARIPESRRDYFRGFVNYAQMHKDIVHRFGRFPHRNAILGRENTPQEETYLAGDAPSFGQNRAGDASS